MPKKLTEFQRSILDDLLLAVDTAKQEGIVPFLHMSDPCSFDDVLEATHELIAEEDAPEPAPVKPPPIKAAWKFVGDGHMLSTSLWWIGFAGPSQMKNPKGKYFAKLCGNHGGIKSEVAYFDTLDEAAYHIEKRVFEKYDGYDYYIVRGWSERYK